MCSVNSRLIERDFPEDDREARRVSVVRMEIRNDSLARNPIAAVERKRTKSNAGSPWTGEEARTCVEFTADDRLGFAWRLLLSGGLRRGELCGLRWNAIDLEAGTMRIDHTLTVPDGRPQSGEPKTEKSRRTLALQPGEIPNLVAHKARQAAEELAAGGAYEDGGYLLTDELGRPRHPDTVSGWFDDKVKQAGLRRIRLHDTRHTLATVMNQKGVPIHVVPQYLGHSSVQITLDLHAHVMPGQSEDAVLVVSGVLTAS